MYTYQDFIAEDDRRAALRTAIQHHMSSEEYKTAVDADLYDRQRNSTINNYVKVIQDYSGNPMVDANAANSKIASNFFYRLNTQLNSYLFGNGVTFAEDSAIKDRLGPDFDTALAAWGYFARIHGSAYGYWAGDKLHVYKLTEFVPLLDELTGDLRAGIRFWSLDWGRKPQNITLYEEDGYTVYQTRENGGSEIYELQPKRGYKQIITYTEADGETIAGEENYPSLPIIPMYGSRLKQSTLVGTKAAIDSYDLIQSGFANDLLDCAQIYWIIENCGGMRREDLQEFLARIRLDHVATADTKSMGVDSSSLKPYAQEIPFQARSAYLEQIRHQIYEAFGALDTTSISAAQQTATEIKAAYQNLDQEADALEYQAIKAIQELLSLLGLEGTPVFNRARIINEAEQVQMVLMEAEYLDEQTVLELLPNIPVDKIEKILERKKLERGDAFENVPEQPENGPESPFGGEVE